MTETNHASEAAASSPDHRLQASSALPDERGLQDIARNVLGYYPATMQAMAVEILRMRRDCPPTAEVEKLRAGASEANSPRLHLSNIDSALREAGRPPTRTRGDELERIHDLAGDRDAWKHKADTLGGDLNRIRSLVPTASDEQTTFDAVQAELQRLCSEAAPFGSSKQFAAETGQAAKHKRIVSELAQVVNRYSLENVCSDTPDFLIAELMLDAAMAFGRFTRGREAHATGRAPRFTNDGPPLGSAPCNYGGSKVASATAAEPRGGGGAQSEACGSVNGAAGESAAQPSRH